MVRNSNFPDDAPAAVPEAERRPILLRSYAEPLAKERPARSRKQITSVPEWKLIFDTETTTDASQKLRFGVYQVLRRGNLKETGLFYGQVTPSELETLKTEAASRGCELFSVEEFVHRRFLYLAFKVGALVVGFNLPFDISRLAIGHDLARTARAPRNKEEIAADAPLKPADRFMAGGFSFELSPYPDQPRLRIKHRNSRLASFKFAKPAHQEEARSRRRRAENVAFQVGNFLDVKTLAAALTSNSHSLRSLAKYLEVKHKGEFNDFDRVIDSEFIDYAINDVETTRQCFQELVRRFEKHELSHARAQDIFSEASLGKAYLAEMGIKPWVEMQKDFDPKTVGAIMSAYFGGRAEVHIRRTITPTIYCDFASMYPTVCTLMGLWSFVIAEGIEEQEATEEIRDFLEKAQLSDLPHPATWNRLTALVQVLPDADIFPVRARYAPKLKGERKSADMSTIGVNYLSSDRPLWFTLADCIASKLLTGKAPTIVRAVRFSPRNPQIGLKPINVAGYPDYRVEPEKDDFFKRVIELRRTVKAKLKAEKRRGADADEIKRLEMDQLALKILANATSYGIFIELNVEEADERDRRFSIFASQGKRDVECEKRESPGRYFHPLLGALITGAARLMLALTERHALNEGLNWAFCDTDSMAFANMSELPFDEFVGRVRNICDWFKPLNPYESTSGKPPLSILEIEDENYGPTGEIEPLFCFAISAKRYALFNLDAERQPIIRKASAHGLGHFMAPYGEDKDKGPDHDSGVRHWEQDVWAQIIAAALNGKPNDVDYKFRREMTRPARSQYSATSMQTLRWFDLFNQGLPYEDQVKPFNFLQTFFAHRQEDLVASDPNLPWDPRLEELRPVAPYERDLEKAISRIFDRKSDRLEPVAPQWLRTVENVLRDYHRQPEYKFFGGGWNEAGVLRRRHVFAERIEDIGKESEGWEEDDARAKDQDAVLSYPASSIDRESMIERIKSVGKRELMREAKIAMRTIDEVYAGGETVSDIDLKRMAAASERIRLRMAVEDDQTQAALQWLKSEVDDKGLNSVSNLLDEDASNLVKVLSGKRKPSRALLVKIEKIRDARSAD